MLDCGSKGLRARGASAITGIDAAKPCDDEVYRRFLDGDEDAAEELIDLYRQGLTLFIFGIVRDMHNAEEIMIETFARIMVNGGRFRGASSLKTYLYSIGRNLAFRFLKKNKREEFDSLDNVGDDSGAAYPSTETQYLIEEKKLLLHKSMQTLKYEHREALHLVYFENMNYDEAGKVLGKTRKQVDNLVSYAKTKLKSELEREGVSGYEE